MIDTIYQGLLRSAVVPYSTREHECKRVKDVVSLTFTSFPLVSARRTAWQSALQEWEWIMSGSTRVADLPIRVQPWWSPWPDGTGYGRFSNTLARGDFSIWDPSGPLPPCSYTGFTMYEHGGSLSTTMYQRSCDLVCGAPHDWVQLWAYSLWLAYWRSLSLHSITWLCPDAHVYDEHAEIVGAILQQTPSVQPKLIYTPNNANFVATDFRLNSPYMSRLTLKAELIV